DTHNPDMRNRAGIILIEENKLALIERHRAGLHYFIFPGGGIDEGESAEQTAIREVEEELGIIVAIKQTVAEVFFNENTQYYFIAEKLSGEFGTGTGEEYGDYDPIHGTYLPLWMPIEDVPHKNVLPRELAELVVRSHQQGWQSEPVMVFEEN
ncbi:MAG: NUDIX domain-containing protein, partial [Anaerolineales bacterium]|nr:NUDIX domain-containing protein [Anaerolineales bacterium]